MSDYSELERRAQAATGIDDVSVAPDVLLELIADLDEARNGMKHSCAIRLKKQIEHLEGERDQLKAENNRLQSAANTLEHIGYTDHGGELWKPPIGQKPNFDQIDQLRAEVAGLRTGYEAYERVNAELKAECEGLRANSSLVVLLRELDSALEDLEIHGQHSDQGYRKLKDWYRKVDLACKAIDAALGKGDRP